MIGVVLAFVIAFFMSAVGYSAYKFKKYRNIQFVNTKEVSKLIHKYGLYNDLNEGKLVCPVSGRVITLNNVGIIRKSPSMPKPVFISNSIDVMGKASDYSDELLFHLSYRR